ncbi:MAG: hypothetical protein PVF05_04545 [Gemmatimonadales bacterium]
MNMRFSTTLAAALLILAATPSLHAQEAGGEEAAAPDAEQATVVGATFQNPGAIEPTEVQVEFTGSGDELGGTILVPGADIRIPLNDMKLTDDRLMFTFEDPGGAATIDCSLNRLKDDSFRGQCEAQGQTAEMTIDAFE